MNIPYIRDFISEMRKHTQNASDPWGYVLGTRGMPNEVCSIDLLKRKYKPDSAHYKTAQKWIGKRVSDCQGLADGFVTNATGVNTDITAAMNFASWCGIRSDRVTDMSKAPPVIGLAVFKRVHSGNSRLSIHHIGFVSDVKDNSVTHIIEAKGVSYGVVRSAFSPSDWECWGLMTKTFGYDLQDVNLARKALNILPALQTSTKSDCCNCCKHEMEGNV